MLQHEAGRHQAQLVAQQLQIFLGPFERWLDAQIDRRLVRTFFLALQAIVRFRHSRCGLLLSELDAHVLSPSQAPAGTKRLSNLLHSHRWSHTPLDRFLCHRADQTMGQLEETGEAALAIWDLHRRQYRKTGILAVPVHHPQLDEELWLVVSRPGKGRKPWYLLTNEPIACPDDAWRVVLAYARRWQVEMCYRACKTDLAMESPRLWFWETRLKLLLMVSLVYAFLLSLLNKDSGSLVQDLLRSWCHRTGKRYREAAIPLSRIRAALSSLWLSYPPTFTICQETPG